MYFKKHEKQKEIEKEKESVDFFYHADISLFNSSHKYRS